MSDGAAKEVSDGEARAVENAGDGENALAEFASFLSEPETSSASLLYEERDGSEGRRCRRRHRDELLKVCRHLFRRVDVLGRLYHDVAAAKGRKDDGGDGDGASGTLSGLAELYTGDDGDGAAAIDAETLWGQIDLQNGALHPLLKKSIKKLGKAAASASGGDNNDNEIRLLGDIDSDSSDGEDDEDDDEEDDESNKKKYDAGGSVEDDEEDDDDDEDEEAADEETRRMRARMERAMEEMEEEDEEEEDEDGARGGAVSRKGGKEVGDGEESLEDPAAEELNDGFFDVNEMEAFADEEEELLPEDAYGPVRPENDRPKDERSFHQKQRDGDAGNDDDDVSDGDGDGGGQGFDDLLFRNDTVATRRRKYREDDEIEALYSLYDNPKDDGDDDDENDVVNMTAADFFGRPNKKYFDKWNAKKKAGNKQTKRRKADDDDESWNDYRFEQEEEMDDDDDDDTGWNTKGPARDDQNEHEEDGEEPDEEEVPMAKAKGSATAAGAAGGRKVGSAHGRQTERLRRQTEEIESEMISEKPWQMTGETTSTSRPVNSLLESTPEFEMASKMAPVITVEHTADLEDVIRRRILNEDWDDVAPRELPDVAWHKKRGELPEVSQEKSKLGLGELYEREYLKKAAGYDVDRAERETEEEAAKSEMKSLFANLCSNLDALSNYHFAPRPVAEEAEIRAATKPAVAMEEVLPLHVSDARAAAPEEVYGTKRGREAVLRGESELDRGDRKRIRSSKKAARRKARKARAADEKLISRLQPGLGLDNPYERRKMREELDAARARGKVTTGEADTNDYGASGTFFRRMQEEAERTVQSRKNTTDGDDKKKEGGRRSGKSSALKL